MTIGYTEIALMTLSIRRVYSVDSPGAATSLTFQQRIRDSSQKRLFYDEKLLVAIKLRSGLNTNFEERLSGSLFVSKSLTSSDRYWHSTAL